MSAQPEPFLSVEEYLAFEETSPERHEYYAGHIVLPRVEVKRTR